MPTAGTGGVVDERGGGGRDGVGEDATGEAEGRDAADHPGGLCEAEAEGGRDWSRDSSHAGGGGALRGERDALAGAGVTERGGAPGEASGAGARDADGGAGG